MSEADWFLPPSGRTQVDLMRVVRLFRMITRQTVLCRADQLFGAHQSPARSPLARIGEMHLPSLRNWLHRTMKTDVEATKTVLIVGLSLLFMVAPPEGFAQVDAGPVSMGNDSTRSVQAEPFSPFLEAPVGQKQSKAEVQLLETFASPNPDSSGSFGFPVVEAGDINGDGTQDFFIGAYLEDGGAQYAGRAYLVSGADGDVIRAFVSPSPDSGGAFGESLAKVDDVNGDGTSDVLVGAPEESVSGVDRAGRAYLLSGTDGDVIQVFESPNPDTLGFYGNSVARVGDVDGNDTAILIGANGEYGAPPEDTVRSGKAYLYKSDGTLIQTIDSPVPTPLGAFGFEVSSIGDVNEDDTRDLVVGAFREGNGVDNAGRTYLLSGADGSPLDTLTSPNPESEGAFGASLTEVGDVNEDDVSDLLIGAPNENGGEEGAGRAYLFSGADESPMDTLTSPNPESGGGFGVSVVGVGNEDPGSTSGVLFGAFREDGGSEDAGRAYLFGTQASSLPLRITELQRRQGAPGSGLRILGSGFGESVTVLLDSTFTATVDSAKSNVIYTQVPEGLPPGPVSVDVRRLGESVSSTQLFTVLSPERGGGPIDRIGPGDTQIPGLKRSESDWADYDRDGDLDLVVTGEDADGNPVTRVYKNGPDDPFANDQFVALGAGLADLKNGAVSWGDYNNDGRPDLAVGGTDGSSPSTLVYRNDGEGTFTEIAGPDSTGLATGDLAWGDLDGDGDLDLVASGLDQIDADGQPKTIVYENKGDADDDGEVEFGAAGTELTGLSFSSVDLGDINGDGNLDLVISGSEGGAGAVNPSLETIVYENQGTGNLGFQPVGIGLEALRLGSAEWGDYNQDGRLDLLLTGRDGSNSPKTLIYKNQGDTDGDGSPNFQSLGAGLTSVESGQGAWGDYDGDGDLDVALSGRADDGRLTTEIYQNDGSSAFGLVESGLNGTEGSVTWADYDQDGDLDILSLGRDDNESPSAVLYDNGLPTPPEDLNTELRQTEDEDFPGLDSVAVGFLWGSPSELNTESYSIYRDTEPIPPRGEGPPGREPDTTVSTNGLELYLDPESSPGQTYYYRVTAVDQNGRESGFSEQARFFWYPEVVSTDAERTFGSGQETSDYRLIALPGRSPDPEVRPRTLPEVLPDEASWRAFWDDGSAPQDYTEYNESETFHLRPGRGFWVLSTETWTGSGSIWETVDLQGDSAAVVNLHDGWNIISNPTGKNLDWNTVLEANDLDSKGLFSFDGTYGEKDVMASAQSGEAYYFLNDAGLEELLLPYPGAPGQSLEKNANKSQEQESRPSLVLQARTDSTLSRAKVQFSETAEEGYGDGDVVAPTSRFSALGLRLENPSADPGPRRGYLSTERRPQVGSGQTFDLALWARGKGPVEVEARRIRSLSGREVSLIVPAQERSYDLREDGSFTVETGQDTTRMRLVVGSSSYVEEQRGEVVPEALTLEAYPNPARQQATLRYGLPEERTVEITVYDVLGRRVAQVTDGQRRPAGRYRAEIGADRLPSGMYFIRMKAGGETKTRKLTVIK